MILAGDFIPQSRSVSLPEFFAGKVALANLEGPICTRGTARSSKAGVCLCTHQEAFAQSQKKLFGVSALPRFAFSLANNHLMDFGDSGLTQTIELLMKSGIPFSGAADCEENARRPMFLEDAGWRIAVFSCCERQFGAALPQCAEIPCAGCAVKGTWLYSAIHAVKSSGEADFVVVSCHAANELSPWVSPDIQSFYRSLIDAGADMVHGHHSHVPQGYEVYRGKPIFYGLGNFVVDPGTWNEMPVQCQSLVVEVSWGQHPGVAASAKINASMTWTIHPCQVGVEGDVLKVACIEGESLVAFQHYLSCCNYQFVVDSDRRHFCSCWQESCIRLYNDLYGQPLRLPAITTAKISLRDRLRKVYHGFWDLLYALVGWEFPTRKSVFYGKSDYVNFSCESHYDATATAMGVLTGILPDMRTGETKAMADEIMGGRHA